MNDDDNISPYVRVLHLTIASGEDRIADKDGIRLFDRADGVKGHYCIGFKDTLGTCHWWGKTSEDDYGWCSAGIVFEHEIAHAVLAIVLAPKRRVVKELVKECCVCKTTENLHWDGWYGYRCDSADCVVF